jgi:hypothetical protein
VGVPARRTAPRPLGAAIRRTDHLNSGPTAPNTNMCSTSAYGDT